MKKILFTLLAMLLFFGFSYAQNQKETLLKNGAVAYTTVTYQNTSGQDLVLALAQGALANQTVSQTKWLKQDPQTQLFSWNVPKPTKYTDLAPYIFTLKKGSSISIQVPSYHEAVGFRCLVADTIYRKKAFKHLNGNSALAAYMAFPDMETDTYLFDKFEAGLTIGFPGIWNITAVDFVAIPLQLSAKGQTVGFKEGVTASGLFTVLNQLGKPYNQGGSITPNSSTKTYRFFSPANIPSATTALDQLISTQAPMIDNSVTINYGNYVFSNLSGSSSKDSKGKVTGTISADYTCPTCNITTKRSITVNDVTTVKSFAGTIVGAVNSVSSDSLAQIQLGAIVSAAICRGILSQPKLWGDIVHNKSNCPYPWNYYPAGVSCDLYSKVIHQYSIHSKNYGFPYDDYFGDEAGFTVLPGDSVKVTILPLTGKMTATPNGAISQQKGCLMVTVPVETIYPKSSSWSIGEMYVESNRVTAGSSVFCSLPNDTIVCTFPSKPGLQLKVFKGAGNGKPAYVFSDKSKDSFKVIGITGMVYDSSQFNMTFANNASWQYSGAWSVNLPPTYSSGKNWNVGKILVNGQVLVSGSNLGLIQNNQKKGDTVTCTFSNQPNLVMCLIQNEPLLFLDTLGKPSKINGISNASYNSSTCTLSFGESAQFEYANSWTISLPASYPSGAGWKIDTIYVNGIPLNTGSNGNLIQNNGIYGDTLICTFSSEPGLQLCLKLNNPPIFRNENGSPCTITGIVGLSNAILTSRSLTFGAVAKWVR
jgi:hypothetical protein